MAPRLIPQYFKMPGSRTFLYQKNKYYLADAGFPTCDTLLIPYRGVRYHLAEWGRVNLR